MAKLCLFAIFLALIFAPAADSGAADKIEEWWDTFSTSWTRYEKTTRILKDMERAFPKNVKVYSIGKTVQGREMWVVKLGKDVSKDRPLLVPPMKIVANMHGDETLGRALLLMLSVDILDKFTNNNPRARHLMTNTEIHLLPSMNVDGFEAAPEGECDPDPDALGRANANEADLNRDFPDQFTSAGQSWDQLLDGRQPETVNMMRWITSNYFVLSANLHALTVVASYPFDSVPVEMENDPNYEGGGVISYSPDHDVFFKLATMYSEAHKTMHTYNNCSKGEFKNGVTNGAEWYNVRGGMQDFNYNHANTFDITFELSCCKFPPAETLLEEWDNNQEALWKYLESSHLGVMGLVSDGKNPISGAKIHVEGIDKDIVTTPRGEYWRLLVPGRYKIWAEADGYEDSKPVDVVVPKRQKLQVRRDFKLREAERK